MVVNIILSITIPPVCGGVSPPINLVYMAIQSTMYSVYQSRSTECPISCIQCTSVHACPMSVQYTYMSYVCTVQLHVLCLYGVSYMSYVCTVQLHVLCLYKMHHGVQPHKPLLTCLTKNDSVLITMITWSGFMPSIQTPVHVDGY